MNDDDDDDDVLKYNKLSYHKQVALCVIKQHNKLTISPDEYDNRQSGIDLQHSHLRTLPVTSADNIRSICPTDIADIICVCPHFTRWNIRRSAWRYRKTLPPDVFKFVLLPNAHITSESHCH